MILAVTQGSAEVLAKPEEIYPMTLVNNLLNQVQASLVLRWKVSVTLKKNLRLLNYSHVHSNIVKIVEIHPSQNVIFPFLSSNFLMYEMRKLGETIANGPLFLIFYYIGIGKYIRIPTK